MEKRGKCRKFLLFLWFLAYFLCDVLARQKQICENCMHICIWLLRCAFNVASNSSTLTIDYIKLRRTLRKMQMIMTKIVAALSERSIGSSLIGYWYFNRFATHIHKNEQQFCVAGNSLQLFSFQFFGYLLLWQVSIDKFLFPETIDPFLLHSKWVNALLKLVSTLQWTKQKTRTH